VTLDEQLDQAQGLVDRAFAHLRRECLVDGRLDRGRLDAVQIPSFDLAACAAELAAARAVTAYASDAAAEDRLAEPLARVFAVEALHQVIARLGVRPAEVGLHADEIFAASPAHDPRLAASLASAELTQLGAALVARDGLLPPRRIGAERELMWETFARFGVEVVQPRAQAIHRGDTDIPDEILAPAASLGLFGVSIPERFGGLQPDDHADTLAMVTVTEALSWASLGAAGSLVTRPEIMARALLAGGTASQQSRWLPRLAAGEALCAISITEPDVGSDVAAIRLRASRVAGGWRLSGAKTWCTFAGRAEVLLVLARTNPDAASGHRGLSLFIVEKPRYPGHEFRCESPGGGTLTGRAIPTIGYRGMHSFDLHFDGFFVPDDALVGETVGEGRGFYFTMTGFAGGRIQTAARANGVMLAAFEAGLAYAAARHAFGQPIAGYPLSQARLARMAAWLTASRQFTYAVARDLDAGGGDMQASLVKFFACRAAEWVTRDAMQLHGGVGYGEESAASRYFVDARVLSIFEGAEETLALKVIARELISAA
jgi:(2S)-methylsuccinyl-CoA dehydrogenase